MNLNLNNTKPIPSEKGTRSLHQRISEIKPTRWIRFGIVSVLFFLWVFWMGNPWLGLLWLILLDIYITAYIPWTWWKNSKGPVRAVMAWVDAIIYALVLVYFIFAFIGQNYKIPSSSLEKSLLVGDYLWVNKTLYGPRVPQTPLHFPLAQHTMPVINTKSYIENPQISYHRLPGIREIKRGDIVVFNYPQGATG
ncbi:MAG: S26 family signal peptidase, partial [Muribaculaceae bacterium]|nr:S26 family signal peptidase [Muribaculaceae bacterium]